MILLIDNYDSFSYNLYQLIGEFTSEIKVIRNDEFSVNEIFGMNPEKIIISPGPGKCENAGICIELIKKTTVPILGVCLGHQAIFTAFGGIVSYSKKLMHGKASLIDVDIESLLFKNLPPQIKVARYHSLSALEETTPDIIKIIAKSDDDEIMAIKHKEKEIYGVQFHPESILTPQGKTIMKNFLSMEK